MLQKTLVLCALILVFSRGQAMGKVRGHKARVRRPAAMAESMNWWVIQQGTNWWAEENKGDPDLTVKTGERRKEMKGRYATREEAEAQAEKLANHYHGTFIKTTSKR